MPEWTAVATDYKYLNRDPDPLVQPVQVHWRCSETDGALTGTTYGADSLGEDMPQFHKSAMARVIEPIMLDWLHTAMGEEWVQGVEQRAINALDKLQNPDGASTPPAQGS